MSFIKVAGKQGLVRDRSTGAIINTDDNARLAYMQKRKAAVEQQLDNQNTKNRISQLENKVQAIDDKLNMIISLLSKEPHI